MSSIVVDNGRGKTYITHVPYDATRTCACCRLPLHGTPHWITYVRSADGALSVVARCAPCWLLHTLPVERDAVITSSFHIDADAVRS
jgi:hypothetical protein